jgi:hypothetical protein
MSRILMPSSGPEQWSSLVAKQSHWRTGYSARSLAHSWEAADGDFPPEVRALLRASETFRDAELLIAVPEHKVEMPGLGRASQTDLWLLARTESGLASIAVEGKVREPFGETVEEWMRDGGDNKKARLSGICELLGIPGCSPGTRYQLLHRTASAIIEARRFFATHAVMIVHSFSQTDQWYSDFEAFVVSLGGTPKRSTLLSIANRSGPTLHVGWVRGDPRFLES